MIGNIIYSLPFHISFPIIGRFIAGVVSAFRPIMVGEIARCFDDQKESTSAINLNTASWLLGYMLGPGINICFVSVDIRIASCHLAYGNIIGVFMALLYLIAIMISHFLVHDLSREYDLKTKKSHQNRHKGRISESTSLLRYNSNMELAEPEQKAEASAMKTFVSLLLRTDTLTLIVASIVARFGICLQAAWISLICAELLGWNYTRVNIVWLFASVPSFIGLILLSKWPLSQKSSTKLAICGILAMIVNICIDIRFQEYRSASLALNIACWGLWTFNFLLFDIVPPFLASTMSQLITSDIQSFGESQRQVFSDTAALLASLVSGLAFNHLVVTCAVHMAAVLFCAVLVLLKYSRYVNPVVRPLD